MLDIDALLHAVLNDPADDVARLIYADRLDETGIPINAVRAEFIRLQLAGVDAERQTELAAEWLADWFGKPVGYAGRGGRRWGIGPARELGSVLVTVSRGFITEVGTYGLYASEWTPSTAWRVAEAFADTVVDVFTDHPVEWVEVEDGRGGQGWQIERSGESTWTADRHDEEGAHVLCKSVVGRTAFAKDLHTALCHRATELVARELYEFSLNRRFAP